MKKRILSLLLALVMLVGLLPTVALAAENELTIHIDLSGDTQFFPDDAEMSVVDKNGNSKLENGKVNTFVYNVEAITSTKTYLNESFNEGILVSKWTVGTTVYQAKKSSIYLDEAKTVQVYLKTNGLRIAMKKGYTAGEYTFKPTLVGSDFTSHATAAADNAEHGTVTATPSLTTLDTYTLNVTEKDGWTFDHWETSTEGILTDENRTAYSFDATLTADTTFTAVFRPWKQVTVKSDPAELEALVVAARDRGDTWTLRARQPENYWILNWTEEQSGTQIGATGAWTVKITPEKDTVCIAHFDRCRVTGLTDFFVSPIIGNTSTTPSNRPLIAGSQVYLQMKMAAIGNLPLSHAAVYQGALADVQAAIEGGNEDSLTRVGSSDFTTMNNSRITVSEWPNYTGKLTAVVYTDGFDEKYYKETYVGSIAAETGLQMTYLSLPRDCKSTYSDPLAATNVHDAATYVDSENGGIKLYIAGVGGVYQMDYSGETAMNQMAGQTDLTKSAWDLRMNGYAYAVGGPDTDHLAAVIHTCDSNNPADEIRIYDPDENQWKTVSGSVLPSTMEYQGKKIYPEPHKPINGLQALIMDQTDIWLRETHWNGAKWEVNEYDDSLLEFRYFIRANATTGYGIQMNTNVPFRYSTETGTWTKVEGLDGTLLSASARDELLVQKSDGSYAVMKDGSVVKSYPAISNDILGAAWTSSGAYAPDSMLSRSSKLGFGGDGAIYAVVNVNNRRYVLKGSESEWTVLNTNEAFDIGNTSELEARSTTILTIVNATDGVSVFYGDTGALYFQTAEYTVTFDSKGGSAVEPYKGQVWNAVPIPQPTREGYTFAGWFTDEDCTTPWTETVIPAANITVYAKWTQGTEDKYAADRAKALEQLEKSYRRFTQSDYSANNWAKLQVEYENGKYQINMAQPNPKSNSQADINEAVNETIYAVLNAAINRMNGIPMLVTPDVQVVVSMDAQTLGLGYLIKPTLVTVSKGVRASKVITDLILNHYKDDSDVLQAGLTGKNNSGEGSEPPYYAYLMQGEVEDSFYLEQVYWPNQQNATVADYIVKRCGSGLRVDEDKDGKYLGEFDYFQMSGWMYSVGQVAENEGTVDVVSAPTFPGVGASGWGMQDGEVMRWQFTVYGYGSDLNADNSAWGSDSITGDIGDKTLLTYKIAELREQYKTSEGSYAQGDAKLETSSIYVNVFENVLQDPLATQATLDQAVRSLDHVKQELESEEDLDSLKQGLSEKLGTIDAIDADSREQLAEARKYYDSLTKEQQELLAAAAPNLYQQLVDGEGAVDAIDKISAIDEVTKDSGAAIKAARDAYDALTDAAKALVGEDLLKTLTDAEKKYEDLTKPVTPVTPVTPSKPLQKPDTGSTLPFTDVFANSWFYDGVKYACEKGFMNGTGSTTFSPNADTTRGMIVTMLARLEGVDTAGTPWYAAGRKWAMDTGISDGTNMTGAVTREQLAAILYRYAKQKGYDVGKSAALTSFTDADTVSSYAVDAMQWAVASGLIQGSGSRLSPKATASRAQVATILMRFMELYAN